MPTSAPATLLEEDEPPAFEVEGREGGVDVRSPFVVACDHAGRRHSAPARLAGPARGGARPATSPGTSARAGWRGGWRPRSTRSSSGSGTRAWSSTATDRSAPPTRSPPSASGSSSPGTRTSGAPSAESRARAIFHPYHDQIRGELDRRRAAGRPSVFVAVHSFTPVFLGVARPWHVGVLFNRDARLAEPLLGLLRREGRSRRRLQRALRRQRRHRLLRRPSRRAARAPARRAGDPPGPRSPTRRGRSPGRSASRACSSPPRLRLRLTNSARPSYTPHATRHSPEEPQHADPRRLRARLRLSPAHPDDPDAERALHPRLGSGPARPHDRDARGPDGGVPRRLRKLVHAPRRAPGPLSA